LRGGSFISREADVDGFHDGNLAGDRPICDWCGPSGAGTSIDDFIITFFTIGTRNTLPTFVWGMIRTSLTPAANLIGTLIILFTLAATLLALRLAGRGGVVK